MIRMSMLARIVVSEQQYDCNSPIMLTIIGKVLRYSISDVNLERQCGQTQSSRPALVPAEGIAWLESLDISYDLGKFPQGGLVTPRRDALGRLKLTQCIK